MDKLMDIDFDKDFYAWLWTVKDEQQLTSWAFENGKSYEPLVQTRLLELRVEQMNSSASEGESGSHPLGQSCTTTDNMETPHHELDSIESITEACADRSDEHTMDCEFSESFTEAPDSMETLECFHKIQDSNCYIM